jgi:DUF2933 family protein
MEHTSDPRPTQEKARRQLSSRFVFFAFLAIAGFYLLTEHTAHVFGILPYLLVFLCPILHLLHGGHGGHHSQHRQEKGGER